MFNITIKIIKTINKFNNKINKKFLGFSLIELLVVVSVIGILSSIAIPVYSDYIVRTRIASEGLVVLDKLKKMVVEYYNSSGRWPTVVELGIASNTFNNTYINNVSLTQMPVTGTSPLPEMDIIVTFTDRVGASVSGTGSDPALRLLSTSTPVFGGGSASNITWKCYSKNIIKRHLPTNCDNIP